MLTLLREHKVLAMLVLVAVVGGGAFVIRARQRADAPAYDTVTVERRDVAREVMVTGTVVPAEEVALAFAVGGRIAQIGADVGDRVAAGTVLVTLDASDLRAARAQHEAAAAAAAADLAALRRGTRTEELRVRETERENAQRALDDVTVVLARADAKGAASLDALYDDAPNVLRDAFAKADDAVRKQTDDCFTNDATANPQLAFRTTNAQAEIDAERDRRAAELILAAWPGRLIGVDTATPAALDALLIAMARDLDVMRTFLEEAVATVNAASELSPATVATYKTNLGTARANVNTAATTADDLAQAIAVQRATNASAHASAEADVTTAANARRAADAALALARAGATTEAIAAAEADLASAEALVAATDADLAKTILRAPFSGIITVQDAKLGAIATAGTPLTTLIADAAFEIRANIPEVDVSGLATGQTAAITLDAYGADAPFTATVASVDPAATVIDGVPTYRTTLVFTAQDVRIRAGMTADVTIAVDRHAGVLAIPQRALTARNGGSAVRALRNGVVEVIPVTVGLRGSDGYVEITDGLREGDVIIRSL